MADKDDEVTPFDDDRWVDRDADDDGTPPWLEDGEDGQAGDGTPPAADDPWAEGEDDWRDRLVDEPAFEPALEEDGLIDRDNEDSDGFSAAEREGRTAGTAARATGPGLSDRDAPPGADRAVDTDDPEGDTLNALAERELSALGEDRYPLDDDDDDEGGDSLYGESTDESSDEGSDEASDASGDDSDGGPEAAAFLGQPRGATDSDDSVPPAWRGPVDRDDERGRPPLVDSDEEAAPFAAAATKGRRWPLALLAMGGLALILVAVGGYGVIAERAALREEIRDLQARLATADTAPGREAAGADAAAALARLGDLEDELAALAQENSVLRARIGDLKGSLDAANGGGMAARDTAAEAPAAGEAPDDPAPDDPEPAGPDTEAPAPAPASKPTATQPAAPAETWFVNFSSYAELGTARRRAAELSVDAGRVVVQDAEANGRTVYRVRVVGISSREAADAVARRLAATYQLPPLWVGRE